MKNIPKPIVLLILDGWGYAPAWGGNATTLANTSNFDKYWKKFPHTTLLASGEAVGLPGHEQGNSEVGHLNIGTGRVVYQDSSRVTHSIKDKSFFSNKILQEVVNHVRQNDSNLHFMGLLTDVATHAHIDHLFALLEFAKKENINKVYLHLFTDGRDSDPMNALQLFSRLKKKMSDLNVGEIATITGRYWAMDRDNHWDRIMLAYNAITQGKGRTAESALQAISSSYKEGKTDEFISPTVIYKNNKPVSTISEGDSVVFFNFRSDRAKQLTLAFAASQFNYFKRESKIKNLYFAGMIPYGYEKELDGNLKSIFEPDNITNPLAEILSINNLTQYHSAETEKYAHVTYFFNGGQEETFKGEDRVLIPSPKVSTYDKKPEMSAIEVTTKLIDIINSKKYDFIVVNYANGDMVGHTGNLKAAIKACETVDICLGKVIAEVKKLKGVALITADHGNCEEMINPKTGQPNTEHSRNPVPLIFINNETYEIKRLRHDGVLADIAPTVLQIIGIYKPVEMTGKSLIEV